MKRLDSCSVTSRPRRLRCACSPAAARVLGLRAAAGTGRRAGPGKEAAGLCRLRVLIDKAPGTHQTKACVCFRPVIPANVHYLTLPVAHHLAGGWGVEGMLALVLGPDHLKLFFNRVRLC